MSIINPPPPGKTFECNVCKRTFANEVDLKSHECSGPQKETQLTDGIG